MTTAVISHPACLEHVTPQGHPEQVARIEYVTRALAPLDVYREDAPLVDEVDLLRVHPQAYIDAIRAAAPVEGFASLDPDTHMSQGSLAAALRVAGGIIRAVDLVMAGKAQNAFVAMRPPGHHAERARAMGFCFFGNVAMAAKYALDHHKLARVGIIDFDVHHGNGTQDLVWDDARIFFASTHQSPLYPGTGAAHETGEHGNVLNVPLPDGTGSADFRRVMENEILPAVAAFEPELILVSAGFDAHRADPLAGLKFTTEDFAWVTRKICDLAQTHCQGRLVSNLEGGYDLQALAASAAAHVQVLIDTGRSSPDT